MTETPDGTPAPQHSTPQHQGTERQPGTPTPERAAGTPWRPADASGPPAASPQPTGDPDAPFRWSGRQGIGGQQGTGPHGSGPHGSGPQGSGPQGGYAGGPPPGGYGYAGEPRPYAGEPHPYAGEPRPYAAEPHPYAAVTGTAVAERPRRSTGKRFIAVGALTAVLGGLAGGGTVAWLDDDTATTTVVGAGLSRDTGTAPTAADDTSTVESAAATALKSVVTLSVSGQQESGTGSGVIIRADGYILTNQHVTAVADDGGSITATLSDGRTAKATLVGEDSVTDLAVVKVDLTGLPAATFADSDAVKIGQTVVAVGSPLGLNGTVTEGIVSALHRATTGGSDDSAVIDALQTDAAINPGNSGGALVDLAGRVVGINQSIATASSGGFGQQGSSGNIGIGFAIPSNTAEKVATQLIATGKAVHAFLGVQAGSSDQQSTTGAPIAEVTAGGAAATAGLKAGDVVTKIDSRTVTNSADLVAAVRSYSPGDEVTLTIRRGTATQTIAVTLGSDAGQQ